MVSPVDPLPSSAGEPARIILLGASNLTRGLSCALRSARLRLELETGEPLEAMVACGHGRSFVIDASIFFRTLPAVRSCRLWAELHERPPAPTFALITDVGNDIMYDVPLEDIINAVEYCLEQLAAREAKIVLAAPPMQSIRTITPSRFKAVRQVLFPTCRVSYAQALDAAEGLDRRLRELAEEFGASVVTLPRQWYGVDPIHIKWKHWPEAWRSTFEPWNPDANPPRARASLVRWVRLKTFTPRHWRIAGIELARQQPAGMTADGTSVSMY